jgi:hypothetical protein
MSRDCHADICREKEISLRANVAIGRHLFAQMQFLETCVHSLALKRLANKQRAAFTITLAAVQTAPTNART